MITIPQPANCDDSCNNVTTTLIPGPQGDPGTDGADGSSGVSAYSFVTTSSFIQPAVGSDVTITVSNSSWMSLGQVVYIEAGGYYSVQGLPTSQSVTLENLGYTGNAAPTTVLPINLKVSPAGIKGTDGTPSTVTLNDISPTEQKGDLLVDDGTNNPAASVIRLPAPANGSLWVADSTQASGWLATVPSISATDSLDFAVFAGLDSQDLTIALVGAVVGEPVELGCPAAIPALLVPFAFVSAPDVVTVRMTAVAAVADPAPMDYTVRINKL